MSLDAAIDAFDQVGTAVEALPKLIHQAKKPTSPRGREKKQVRSSSGGGGVARARMSDEISAHCLFICGRSVLLIGAVADCLVAARSRDNTVNAPALAISTRALVETAALVAWLVNPSIDGNTRGRRFLAWRFSELHSDRSVLKGMDDDRSEVIAARAEFGVREKELVDQATAAKWHARASSTKQDGQVEPAVLLQLNSVKGHAHASITDMVQAMMPGSAYQLLSIAAHGKYAGIIAGTRARSEPDSSGGITVGMAGFGITPSMALTTVCNSVTSSTRQLAAWNCVGTEQLDSALRLMFEVAGSIPDPK